MDLQEELFLVTKTLHDAGIEYALCGGIAVIVHGYPRMTRDINLLIREEDLDRSRKALADAGYTLESGLITFEKGKPTERHLFRLTKAVAEDFLSIDLILVGSFLEDVWKGREQVQVEERSLCVVSRDGLAKMKRAAGRPQDLADLAQLDIDSDAT